MAKYLVLIIFLILMLGLSIGFASGLSIFGGTFNLIVIILVAGFFLEVEKEGLVVALVLAVIYDFYTFSYFGLAIMAVLLIYFAIEFLEKKLSPDPGYLLFLVYVFFGSLIFDLIVFNLRSTSIIFVDALVNLLIALPLLIILRYFVSVLKLYRLVRPQEKRIALF